MPKLWRPRRPNKTTARNRQLRMNEEKEEKALVLPPDLLYMFTEETVEPTPEGKVPVLWDDRYGAKALTDWTSANIVQDLRMAVCYGYFAARVIFFDAPLDGAE